MKNYSPKIPKDQLEHGAYYFGRCRNANVARWNAETEKFYYWRNKFNNTFLEEIECPEDEDYFDVFVTERKLESCEVEKEIPFN